MRRRELVKVAIGEENADLVIKGGKLINVYTDEIYYADIAVKGDRIAFIGNVDKVIGKNTLEINAEGKYISPGFIDTHQHGCEAHLNMTEYARTLILHGTTTVSEAFYDIGLVGGMKGIKFCYEELKKTPLKVLFLVPILAYLQNRELNLPEAPNSISMDDLYEMLNWPECVGLEEPPYLPIVEGDEDFLNLFEKAINMGKIITGHACGLREGPELNAYVAMGARSDHEAVIPEEAIEKARLGMSISMREGSGASDVLNLVKALTENKIDSRSFTYCGDEVSFHQLHKVGHLDHNIRLSISSGLNPIKAIQIATINAAELFKVSHNIGSITPGKIADILLIDDLRELNINTVIANGSIIVKENQLMKKFERPEYPKFMYDTIRLRRPTVPDDFRIRTDKYGKVKVRVIGITDGSLISDERVATLDVVDNNVLADTSKDVLKIAMVDRYNRFKEQVGLGFIQGFNIKEGAIGSTYNPMYQNIVLVGTNEEDMSFAANTIAEMGGGFVAVKNGKVLAKFEMPLFGVLSDKALEPGVEKVEELLRIIKRMGCQLQKDPFHTLAFACVVGEIGNLKLSHDGLFDVQKKKRVPTIID